MDCCDSSKRYVRMLILVVYVVFMSFGDGEISRNPNFINVCNLRSNLGGLVHSMLVWGSF